MKRNLVERIIKQDRQDRQDRQDKIKIEFEQKSIIRQPGPCPVCDGKGGWDIRSNYDHRIVSHRVCRYCGGCGRIPRT